MTPRTRLSTVAALSIGGALSLLGPALPAVGSESPPQIVDVEITSPTTLQARGAAVSVPIEVTCDEGQQAFLNVTVTQARGRFATNGFGGTRILCDGTIQTVLVTVTAQQGGSFKQGIALVQADLNICPNDFSGPCVGDQDIEEVSITR